MGVHILWCYVELKIIHSAFILLPAPLEKACVYKCWTQEGQTQASLFPSLWANVCSVMSDSLRPHGLYVPCQVPLSMELSRQEYWSGLPFPTPGGLPNPRIETASPTSPALAGRFFTTQPPGKPVSELPSVLCGSNDQSQREHERLRGLACGKSSNLHCHIFMCHPWLRKIPWRRKWQPTPVFLPGKSHGQRSQRATV